MNLYPITIVENFYENPETVREFALSQQYKFRREIEGADYVFPGCRTEDVSLINRQLYEKVSQKINAIFHNTQYDHMRWLITTNFQSVTAE